LADWRYDLRFPGFIGPSYQLRSVNVDCQRSVNLYPELDETGNAKEKSIGSMIGTPGLSAPIVTLPTSPFRGSFLASNGALYVVSGNSLYTISSAFAYTLIGTILTSSGPVSMADNGIQLVLVDGANGWWAQLTQPLAPPSAITKITSPNFLGPASQVVYQDGRFIFNIPNTNQFFVSDQLAVTFSGAFDAASAQPDNLIGMLVQNRNLWLFGQKTTEIWFDAGNPPPSTPFSLIQGGFIEIGLAAQFSIKKIDNTFFFIGTDDAHGLGAVYTMNGFSPQRISTHAIELAIQSYGDISGTTAWAYQDGGHNFYCLNFKNTAGQSVATSTWVYDLQTGSWHERVSLNQGQFQRALVEDHAYFQNIHVVGDYMSGNLYQMSLNTYTDNGAYIPRERTFPHLNANMKRIFNASLQLDLEPGVGSDGTNQGNNPQAMLQFSDNGGNSWSNEKWAPIGAIGEKRKRVIWRRLGQARDKVYRVRITDPVKVVLIGAELLAGAGQR
jgi:hypothetical protein